jgi:hypothetical protein
VSARYWSDVARTDDPTMDDVFGPATHVLGDDAAGGIVAVVSGGDRADHVRDALNDSHDGPVVELTNQALLDAHRALELAIANGLRIRVQTRADGLVWAIGGGMWTVGVGRVQ